MPKTNKQPIIRDIAPGNNIFRESPLKQSRTAIQDAHGAADYLKDILLIEPHGPKMFVL